VKITFIFYIYFAFGPDHRQHYAEEKERTVGTDRNGQ
jgi:cbb3-type cytochrome oxidase subunit 3